MVEWAVVVGDLSGAVMLIWSKAAPSLGYTDAEMNAVRAWFDADGKAIWVAGDSAS